MRVLVVDDEPTLRTILAQTLEDDGHEVVTAPDGEQALSEFRRERFPLVMTDIVMPGGMDGLELLRQIRDLEPDSLVVVMTSFASLETAVDALRAGAFEYLTKPFDELDLVSAVVARAEHQIGLVEQNKQLIADLERKTEELESLNASLRNLANHDPLTGLDNRRAFHKALHLEIERSSRHDRRFTLMMIDVDRFKRYNDTHGHPAGDALLKAVAGRIKQLSRLNTTVARYGGEEFVLLVPEADRTVAGIVAERVRAGVESFEHPDGAGRPEGRLTLSLGVSCYPDDGEDAETLIQRADAALYQAKTNGRNRFVLWSEIADGADGVRC